MSFKIKKIKLLIFLIISFFTISLLAVTLFKNPGIMSKLKFTALSTSSADITVKDNNLNIKFKIIPADQQKFEAFSSNLGVGTNWGGGIEFALNKEAIEKLSKITPANVSLKFEDTKVTFGSSSFLSLQSALPNQSINYSTGSGTLNLKANNEQDFVLKLTNPKDLLIDATLSGKLRYSPKLEIVFPISEKIATIELRVKGKNINGEINLKD